MLNSVLPPNVQGAGTVILDDGRIEIRRLVAGETGKVIELCTLRDSTTLPGLPLVDTQAVQEVAKLTHDLNNVFTVIYAAIDMVIRHPLSAKEAGESLEDTQKAARRGAQMVTRIRQLIGRDTREPVKPDTCPVEAAFDVSLGREKILVVSTHRTTRILIRAVLSYRGYEVSEAESLEQVEGMRAGERQFQLLITDEARALPLARTLPGEPATLFLMPKGTNTGSLGEQPVLETPFQNPDLASRVRAILDGARKGAGS